MLIISTKTVSIEIAKFNGGSEDPKQFWYKRVEHLGDMPIKISDILNNIFNNPFTFICTK